jgi:protein-disulfide isomerase
MTLSEFGFSALALALLSVGATDSTRKDATGPKIVAMVGSESITAAELDELAQPRLMKLRTEEDGIKRAALAELVNRRLLSQVAAARGLTAAGLLAEIERSIPVATTDEIRAIYESNPAQFRGKELVSVADSIRQNLQRSRIASAQKTIIDAARKSTRVSLVMEPFRVDIPRVAPVRSEQQDAAGVRVVVFSDYLCPHCASVHSLLSGLLQQHVGRVSVEYRHFPILQPSSRHAAEAAACAYEQDAFGRIHDTLFENQRSLSAEKINELASAAVPKPEVLQECMTSGRGAGSVDRDVRLARSLGVSATPAVFVNGRLAAGGGNPASISALVAEEVETRQVRATPTPAKGVQ